MPSKIVNTHPMREALEATRSDLAVIVPATMKDGFACQQGDVLGVITSSGLVRRRTRSAVGATAFAANSAAGSVADGTKFRVGDVLKNAAGANVGTIQAINGNNITLTGNAAVAVATGADVMASDGSEVAICIADDASDGSGDTPMSVIISGLLKESLLLGLDSTAKTELGGRTVPGGIFKF